jgi:single-stranded-DNA-specific exonuclease
VKNDKISSVVTVKTSPPADQVSRLAAEIQVDPIIAALLIRRGIHSFEEARNFFRPNLDLLHNPFEMKDMRKAVDRLCLAIDRREKILVYGDYDVDGTTSVAMVYSFLVEQGVSCDYYIPDRNLEGYGFSFASVEYARENGISLIITLDCGIRDGAKVDKASEFGIDVIICDHHHPQELPRALAVLDPHRDDCEYPFKGLSGCGVGFKFLQAYCIERNRDIQQLFGYLDLLTISIGADIVPIIGENRILAAFGLQLLSKTKRPGVKALLDQAAFRKSQLSISDVVFILAPRINAAGRIVSGRNAVKLLLEGDAVLAKTLSAGIEENNKDRKALDKTITVEAKGMVTSDEFYSESYSTVVYHQEWHKGVVGIVAARLVEAYYKPAIVLTGNKGKLSGSARSIPGLDLFQSLEQCEFFIDYFCVILFS